MQTILVCDDNVIWLEGLSVTINKEPLFEVVAQAKDGREAIEQIEKYRPDIVILDIVLPEYDGVYVVNYIRRNMSEYTPVIYMLSGLGTDPVVKQLNELGIDFYSMKPVPMEVVIDTLMMLVKRRGMVEDRTHVPGGKNRAIEGYSLIETQVRDLLRCLGIRPHLASFQCVFDAIMSYPRNAEYHISLSKDLYPQVAKKHRITISAVDRNIRSAISQMQKHDTEAYNSLFSYTQPRRVTSGLFLSELSNHIRKMETKPVLEEGCDEQRNWKQTEISVPYRRG